jgi:hypothetical protein
MTRSLTGALVGIAVLGSSCVMDEDDGRRSFFT